jgi:hypothetical protein
MPTRAWTFSLDGLEHHIELEYTVFTAWEKLTVDGEVLAEGRRWQLVRKYDFHIGSHECLLTFDSPMNAIRVSVAGVPAELLPCNTLLRPASGDEHTLVRPSHASASAPAEPESLLRPALPPDEPVKARD